MRDSRDSRDSRERDWRERDPHLGRGIESACLRNAVEIVAGMSPSSPLFSLALGSGTS